MTRWVDVEALVGSVEIARRLGFAHAQHIHYLRNHDPSFPAPVAEVGRVGVWDWGEIEGWARSSGRLADEEDDDAGSRSPETDPHEDARRS